MEKTLISDGQNRQLRLEKEPVPEKMYEVRMILHNRPQGLLPFRTEETPEGLRCDYHISGLRSLQESAEEEDTDYLYSVLFSLERLAGVFYEYLLSPDRLMLEPDTIFLKKETGVVYFCYYPGKPDTFQEALQALMEYFLKIRNPTKEEDVLLLYGLYQRSREADVTMTSLAEYWRETENKLKDEKREQNNAPYVSHSSAVQDPEEYFKETGGNQRLYDDLGLQVPDKENPFSRWKKRGEMTNQENGPQTFKESRHVVSEAGNDADRWTPGMMMENSRNDLLRERSRDYRDEFNYEQERKEGDGKKEALKQYIKQNYIQLTAVVLVIGFIIWFLLN